MNRYCKTVLVTMAATAYIVLALCALANGAFLRRPLSDGRIVGGEDAKIEDLPYQLSLMIYGSHACGASIISDEWALTAAHCTDGISPRSLSIRAGSSIRNQGGTVHRVAQVIQHEQYDKSNYDYDFALIRIISKFNIGQDGVQVIELVDEDGEPVGGENCVVSGWGLLASDGELSNQLQVVNVPIVHRFDCSLFYYEYGGITDRMICAATEYGGKDACQGDSGGPLVIDGKLTGVVSYGIDCGAPEYPGVYSNIANQRAWIKKNTGI